LIQAAQSRLLNFCQLLNPKYEAVWFHELLANKLEDVLFCVHKKQKARLILTLPPRHGKSQLSSIYFPAWALGKYPEIKFIFATYGADLAEKMGLSTRDVISSEGYQAIFPGVELRPDVKAKAKWMTNKQGSYTAVGAGGAITGQGGDIIICDDLIKSRDEAESATMQDFVWEYYRSTLYSRLEGYGGIIMIMQRWNQKDIVARLLEEDARKKLANEPTEDWEVINFPAIAEDDEFIDGVMVRKAGEPLWPSKFPLPVLENIRSTAGIYNFVSQYQQDPIATESQEFKEYMFKYFNEEDLKMKYLRYYTLIDPAISQKKSADNTVVLTIAKEVNGPNWYRIREDANKMTPSQTIELIFLHQSQYKSEVSLETVAYQLALKFAILEEQKKREKYFTVNEVKTSTNKEVRIRGLLPLYESGVIYHRKSDVEYERELLSFPRGRRDDRCDVMSMALGVIQNTTGRAAKQSRPRWIGYAKK
jgi:predicted phage terminase large subunit-like protein